MGSALGSIREGSIVEGMQQELALSLLERAGACGASSLSKAPGSAISVASTAASSRQSISSRDAFINALLTARVQLLEGEGIPFIRSIPGAQHAWPSPSKETLSSSLEGESDETREDWKVARRYVTKASLYHYCFHNFAFLIRNVVGTHPDNGKTGQCLEDKRR